MHMVKLMIDIIYIYIHTLMIGMNSFLRLVSKIGNKCGWPGFLVFLGLHDRFYLKERRLWYKLLLRLYSGDRCAAQCSSCLRWLNTHMIYPDHDLGFLTWFRNAHRFSFFFRSCCCFNPPCPKGPISLQFSATLERHVTPDRFMLSAAMGCYEKVGPHWNDGECIGEASQNAYISG